MGKYFKQHLSEEIFKKKYCLQGEESPEQVFEEVSAEISSVEDTLKKREYWNKRFNEQLSTGKLIPAGRILANARPNTKMPYYNNCYTIGVDDSLEGIFESLKEDAIIGSVGGGVGFNISELRPKGAPIKKGGESSGVISFLKVFDQSAQVIMTGGSRRCLPAGTWVNAKRGMIKIEDVLVGDLVLTSNGYERVTNFFDQGVQKTITIKTKNGDFECTPNHKMPVFDSISTYTWKEAKYLTDKDKLVFVSEAIDGVETSLPKPTSTDIIIPPLDEEIAWYLGMVLGDGVVKPGSVSIYTSSVFTGITRKLESCFRRFGCNPITKDLDGGVSKICVYSSQLSHYLLNLNTQSFGSSISVPDCIMQGSIKTRSGFLAGLFDSSGSTTKADYVSILETSYIEDAKEISAIYSSLGIMASVRPLFGSEHKYIVSLSMEESIQKFIYYIEPYCISYVDSKLGNSESPIKALIPVDVLSLDVGRDVQTYDIEVANKHEFVSGGFLTHNSAHIAILNIDHPDIIEFITCKHGDDNDTLTQFNISVGITDKFIDAVDNDLGWDLVFGGKIYDTVKARWLYDLITANAYQHNEPGIFNLDTVEKYNNGYYAFKVDRVNPCGEICMPSYSLCCLSAINLTKFVVNPFSENCYFDLKELRNTIGVGVRFLDNVLDATKYPLDKIEILSKEWRRIGLGFTGLGNVFSMMRMKYGSLESRDLSHAIGEILRNTSYKASAELAKEKGPFPGCDIPKLMESNFIKKIKSEEVLTAIRVNGLRNIALNTIAPTGTTSLSLGQNCSSGIEPAFSLKYNRNYRTGSGSETAQETIYDYAYLLYKDIFGEEAEIPDYFSTTLDIDVLDGLEIQAIFQEYIDHSISKTMNLKPGTTFEEYKDLFMLSYKKGLKGFTSFNPEGSMKGVLEHSKEEKVKERVAPKRPKELDCDIHHISSKGEKLMVLVGVLDGKAYELFVAHPVEGFKAKTGKIIKARKGHYKLVSENGDTILEDMGSGAEKEYGAMTRLLSLPLRHQGANTPIQFLVDTLVKEENFTSFSRGVARVLKKYVPENEAVLTSDKCAECGSDLKYVEGCKSCQSCGWSKCS